MSDPALWRAWTPAAAAEVIPGTPKVDAGPLAFVLHAAELVNHYRPIWAHLPRGSFEIIAAGETEADNRGIADAAEAVGARASWVGDVVRDGRVFGAAVSNHVGAAGTLGSDNVLPMLATRHVRMMYALGKDAWNFAPWNEQYDLILCWGPYHAGRLEAFERPRVIQVGYPRLDRISHMPRTRREAVASLGGDPDLPTLLWLPTWSAASSIDAFAGTIAGLRDTFNVLLKVHPFTALREPERMALLAEVGLASTDDAFADNVDLIHAADMVAADYGGSAFAAIYADREIAFLNTPGVGTDPADPVVGQDSLEVRLREWILNIDPGEGDLLLAHLGDAEARRQQAEVRERLRRQLFAPFRGCAGEVAATALRNLGSILR